MTQVNLRSCWEQLSLNGFGSGALARAAPAQ